MNQKMKVIRLQGEASTRKVWLNEVELTPDDSQKLRNHSPDGFNWGYGGSGPAQLALAVMYAVYGDDGIWVYQDFKQEYIQNLPIDKDFDVQFKLSYLQV